MVFQIDATTAAAVLGNPQVSVNVMALTPSGAVQIPVVEDQSGINYDITSMQVRTATLVVERGVTDAGYLNPLSDKVYIRVSVAGGLDIPLFIGRVSQINPSDQGRVQVSCIDTADDLAGNSFYIPWSTHGGTVGQEITELIHATDTSFGVDIHSVPIQMGVVAPILTWEEDRCKAIDDLTRGALCLWRSSRTGGFEFFANPFASTDYVPVMVFKDGEHGTLVSMQSTKSRASVYNSITVIVERTDGTLPIRVTLTDNDPASPTYYYGAFGKRNKNYKIQAVVDQPTALVMAQRILRESVALAETWSWTAPFAPHIDPGDIVSVWYRDVVSPVYVETMMIPLSFKSPMQFTGRRLQLLDRTLIGSL